MNFDITSEQKLLQDTLRRMLSSHYGLGERREYAKSSTGFSQAMWRRYAEMGLLALPFSEKDGGLEASPVETLVTMQELGRALALEPYLETVVICGGLLRRLGSEPMRSATIPRIIAGDILFAFAHEGNDAPGSCVAAERLEGGFRLQGRVPLVVAGAAADQLLVPAALEGRVALLMIDRATDGLTARAFQLHDGTQAAELRFDRVLVAQERLVSSDAYADICRVMDEANAALCAEVVGAMEEAFELTRDYIRTRQQFGVSISTFQSLRHQLADMVVHLEHARSMAILAVMRCGSDDTAAREGAVSAAKVQISGAARALGQSAIQLHGGIGMTEEYKLGHLFKRMEALGKRLGDAGMHLSRLAAINGPVRTLVV
ncbi:MAG: acyl-CoA dehydrogenase [Burkholderiales bacterium]